jgi:hypothetical protein
MVFFKSMTEMANTPGMTFPGTIVPIIVGRIGHGAIPISVWIVA